MSIDDLKLKGCYIGNKEVIKIYRGDTLIYDKASLIKIYERNGNLIIPAGTVCQVKDYSGSEPVTTEYILPSDIVISGTDGDAILSDGTRFYWWAQTQQEDFSYIGTVETVDYNRDGSSKSKTFDFTKNAAISYGTSYRSGLVKGASFMTPISHFKITNMPDGYQAMFSIQMYDGYGNNAKFYLHDYGTTEPDDWRDFYQVKDPVKISEDDIELNNQYPGSGDVKYWIWTNRNLCIAEKDHYYSIYVIYTDFPSTVNLSYLSTSYASLFSRKITTYYNEPLSVRLSGFKWGDTQDIQVDISYYDYPEKLGTTKINEELKYYDVIPSE